MREKGQQFRTEEFQLINVERMREIGIPHKNATAIIAAGEIADRC